MFKRTLLIALMLPSCWKDYSPDNLIRLKDKFKSQVNAFENKKETANRNVNKGLESLNVLKSPLEDIKMKTKNLPRYMVIGRK